VLVSNISPLIASQKRFFVKIFGPSRRFWAIFDPGCVNGKSRALLFLKKSERASSRNTTNKQNQQQTTLRMN